MQLPAPRTLTSLASAVLLLGLGGGCAPGRAPRARAAPLPSASRSDSAAPLPVERLPEAPGPFAPSHVRLVDGQGAPTAGGPRAAERLADVRSCADCHADVHAGWRSSAHARASFDNPWYRQGVEAFRAARGAEASRFCAGCHDPVLLVAGAIDREIGPDDPLAHAGVTCRVCHGIREVRPDGVASYTLSTEDFAFPDPADASSVTRHVADMTPEPLRTAALCGSCHRGFLGREMGNPHHLPGVDDLTPFQASGYAGSRAARVDEPIEATRCQGCHMREVGATRGDFAGLRDGVVRSHRFAGAHTALASAARDAAQLTEERAMLEGAARVDVPVVRRLDGGRAPFATEPTLEELEEGIAFDVVVRNVAAGHRFPGGLRDAQDTWLEVVVQDARGDRVAQSGEGHARDPDDDAYVLSAWVVDDRARLQRRHLVERFRALLADDTVAPRDAVAVRYALRLPASFHPRRLPLSVTARLLHRSRTSELHAAACVAERSPVGRRFLAASRTLGHAPLDACRPQPITEVASARVWVGPGAETRAPEGGARDPAWRRAFDHALALAGELQERVDDARPSLARALAEAPDARARAMVFGQLARLEGRQGRVEAALAAAAAAEALIGPHPALDRARADALARVWRWVPAAGFYARAAHAAPLDVPLWASLAVAEGSAGHPRASFEASLHGLALSPRHGVLLRAQHLALTALLDPPPAAPREAFLAHRDPDARDALVARCAAHDPRCAARRLRVPTIPLVGTRSTR